MIILVGYIDIGCFMGCYVGLVWGEIEEIFEQNLVCIFVCVEMLCLLGVQIKVLMSLMFDGFFVLVVDQLFIYILKFVGMVGFEMLLVVEWFCLEFGCLVGFDVFDVVLLEMLDSMLFVLVVEWFDICCGLVDQWCLVMEDFCFILDFFVFVKYDGMIEWMVCGL